MASSLIDVSKAKRRDFSPGNGETTRQDTKSTKAFLKIEQRQSFPVRQFVRRSD